jgi:hypothetical protein
MVKWLKMIANNNWWTILKFVNFQLSASERTDVCDVSQFLVFIRLVFNDGNIK